MRQAYAHHAVLVLERGADAGAPGATIGAALDGRSVIDVSRDGDQVRLRILFATEPHRADEVRERIDAALAAGDWQVVDAGCTRIEPADRAHARRLLKPG